MLACCTIFDACVGMSAGRMGRRGCLDASVRLGESAACMQVVGGRYVSMHVRTLSGRIRAHKCKKTQTTHM